MLVVAHHPSTMVPTYPSTISRSYGAGGAGRDTEDTGNLLFSMPGDTSVEKSNPLWGMESSYACDTLRKLEADQTADNRSSPSLSL